MDHLTFATDLKKGQTCPKSKYVLPQPYGCQHYFSQNSLFCVFYTELRHHCTMVNLLIQVTHLLCQEKLLTKLLNSK